MNFQKAFDDVQKVVEERYGVPVGVVQMQHGFSGDLNGLAIFINEAVGWKQRLFNLSHLFGHTVQWAVREDGYFLGHKLFDKPDDELLERLIEYEKEAARYSAALLLEANNEEFLPWLSKYSDADIRFLEHYYRTGEKKSLREFRRKHVADISPLQIPPFERRQKALRGHGIVLLARGPQR